MGRGETSQHRSTGLSLTSIFQTQGRILDQRRVRAFKANPGWLLRECEDLGLFTARMPRFSQLFFYQFSELEEANCLGQPLSSPPCQRAAEAFLRSRVRLESTCGVSNVWYSFLGTYQAEQRQTSPPSTPHSSLAPSSSLEGSSTHPRPFLQSIDAAWMSIVFQWTPPYIRPLPKKKPPTKSLSLILSQPTSQSISESDQTGHSTDYIQAASPASPGESVDGIGYYADEEDDQDQSSIEEDVGEAAGEAAEHDALLVETGGWIKGESVDHTLAIAGDAVQEDDWMDSKTEAGFDDEFGDGFQDDDTYDFGSDLWPRTSSFNALLSVAVDEAQDGMGRVPELPYTITDAFVPSSVPEERELVFNPSPTKAVKVAGVEETGAEDEMEGVEASQPISVHGSSSDETTTGEAKEATDMEDVEYTPDRKWGDISLAVIH